MNAPNREGGWTQTYTGKQFYALDAYPEDFDIRDIAHALALVNRYNGHTPVPYSVAQHSVIVSYHVPKQHRLWGLLHDMSEAFIGDFVQPVKRNVPQYGEIETSLMIIGAHKFGLEWPEPPEVKVADLMVLAAESRDLFPVKPADWNLPYGPIKQRIKPVGWRAAERMFLKRFEELHQP